jgi:selenocysteine lyase/cysteine desulfurase
MSGGETQPEISTLAQLRADIALTRDFAFFQTGSEGPVPDSTQRVVCATLREASGLALGGVKSYSAFNQRAEGARQTLAALLNVSTEELAWTQNTTSAIDLAVRSLPWRAGDRLALSGTEHTSTRTLVQGLEQFTGCKTTVIPVGDGTHYSPELFLGELDRLLTSDHRLLIISQVSCIDGRRLPVVEATRIAQGRGVKVLVDGAQAVGQFPVDVAEIDPEFYAGSVHKWLLGPAGIGYLVVARRQLPEFNPRLRPRPQTGEPVGNASLVAAASQTEIGTQSLSLRLGTGHAAEMVQRIGLDRIESHICALTARLRDGLRRVKGFNVLTPDPWELSSGITSLQFPHRSAAQVRRLIERIWVEYQAVVKFQVDFSGIRISVASFNSLGEVERLLAALTKLVPEM